jgi:hypothetical protein
VILIPCFRLKAELKELNEIKKMPVDEWLHRDSTALDLANLSDRIDLTLLEFRLVSTFSTPGPATDYVRYWHLDRNSRSYRNKITVEPPPP